MSQKKAKPMTALRTLREAAGIRRERLAADAGCSFQHLIQVEAGRSTPSMPMAYRIARALGVTVEVAFPELTGSPLTA